MQIFNNQALQSYTTFGVPARARRLIEVEDSSELKQALAMAHDLGSEPKILGGGSNVLLTGDVDVAVLRIAMRGIEAQELAGSAADKQAVLVHAAAGEHWHELVLHCVERGWGGIENLALIPGLVGAAPVQNIGAYGVELCEVLAGLEAYDRATGELIELSPADCKFAYRDSIFKREWRERMIITRVSLRLYKNAPLRTHYGAIEQELETIPPARRTFQDVCNAVIRIRRSKLPYPDEVGNAGSFFKNPIIDAALFEQIKSTNPTVPSYPVDEKHIKVPAGWLIEQCGWKGKRIGNTGAYHKQALVLVNYGGARGAEIAALAQAIQASVAERFGIQLQTEVNIW